MGSKAHSNCSIIYHKKLLYLNLLIPDEIALDVFGLGWAAASLLTFGFTPLYVIGVAGWSYG